MSRANQTYLDNRRLYSRPQAILFSDNPGVNYNDLYFPVPSGYEYGAAIPEGESPSFLILSDHNRSSLDLTPDRIQKRDRMVNGTLRSWHIADKKSLRVSWSMLPSRAYYNEPAFIAEIPSEIAGITKATKDSSTTTVTIEFTDAHPYIANDTVSIVGVTPSVFNLSDVKVLETTETEIIFDTPTITVGYTSGGEVTRSDIGVTSLRRTDTEYTVDGGAGGVELLNWYETHVSSFYVFLAYDKYNNLENQYRDGQQAYNEVLKMIISDFSYNVIKRGGESGYDFWDISMTLEEE